MSNTVAASIRDLHKSHDDAFHLRVEQMQIPSDKTCCLLGPTGAGKSTLLRILAGVEADWKADLTVLSEPVSEPMSLSQRRQIAMVFQRPQLLRTTVRANIEYPLKLRGLLPSAKSRVDAVLEQLRLTAIKDQTATTLSGGQTQLVAMGRALIIEPTLLLLDEPTANLDPAHVALVERVIREHREQTNSTIIWATHNLFQARRVADRVGLLLDGKLIEEADAETFFKAPRDPRSADFVNGKMIY